MEFFFKKKKKKRRGRLVFSKKNSEKKTKRKKKGGGNRLVLFSGDPFVFHPFVKVVHLLFCNHGLQHEWNRFSWLSIFIFLFLSCNSFRCVLVLSHFHILSSTSPCNFYTFIFLVFIVKWKFPFLKVQLATCSFHSVSSNFLIFIF